MLKAGPPFSSSDRSGSRWNAFLGTALEAVNAAVEILLLPSLILAFFAAELTPSYATIGLVPAIAVSFWSLARVPALLITSMQRRQQPWAFAAAIVRAGAIAVLAVVVSRVDPESVGQTARPLIAAFFLCLIVYALASGFHSVPASSLLRSTIAGDVWPSFLRQRALWCGVFSVLAALIAERLLGASELGFPAGYGQLFLTATICLVAAAALTAALREPPAGAASSPMSPVVPRAWRQPLVDSNFRRFLVFRVLLSATSAADPFLFLYAVTRLGAPISAIGGYVVAGVLGWVASAPAWLWLERRSGARAVLQSAAVIRLVAPAIALAVPPLATTVLIQDEFPRESAFAWVYGVGFFAIGAALAAQARGAPSYLGAVMPRHLVATATGIANGILAIVAFTPVFGGMLIQRTSYETLFVAVLAIGLAAVFAGGALTRTPSPSFSRRKGEPETFSSPRALPAGPG